MTLGDDVDLEEFVMSKDDLSGADIKVSFPTFFSKKIIRLFVQKRVCLLCENVG